MPVYEATILTSPADGISPSLLLNCGDQNIRSSAQYLFNLPESLDRLASDQKVRMNNVHAIFIPEVSTDAMGGLGSRLFMSVKTNPDCSIIAPLGFQEWLAGVRLISRRLDSLHLDHYVTRANGKVYCYKDSLMDVAAITRDDSTVKLPMWLGPGCSPRVPIVVEDGGKSTSSSSGSPDKDASEDEEGKSRDNGGSNDADEVADAIPANETEIADRDTGEDDLPEVICIDFSSGEDNQKNESLEGSKRCESMDKSGTQEGELSSSHNSEGDCSKSSSEASFIPVGPVRKAHLDDKQSDLLVEEGQMKESKRDKPVVIEERSMNLVDSTHEPNSKEMETVDGCGEQHSNFATKQVSSKGLNELNPNTAWHAESIEALSNPEAIDISSSSTSETDSDEREEVIGQKRSASKADLSCERKRKFVKVSGRSGELLSDHRQNDNAGIVQGNGYLSRPWPQSSPSLVSGGTHAMLGSGRHAFAAQHAGNSNNFMGPSIVNPSVNQCLVDMRGNEANFGAMGGGLCIPNPNLLAGNGGMFQPVLGNGTSFTGAPGDVLRYSSFGNGRVGNAAYQQWAPDLPNNLRQLNFYGSAGHHLGQGMQGNHGCNFNPSGMQLPGFGPMGCSLGGMTQGPGGFTTFANIPGKYQYQEENTVRLLQSSGIPPTQVFSLGNLEESRVKMVLCTGGKEKVIQLREDAVFSEHQGSVGTVCKGPGKGLSPILAYIIHLKATNRFLMVIFARKPSDINRIQNHPAWVTGIGQADRIDAIFHLSEKETVGHEEYKNWMKSLPGKQVLVDSGNGKKDGLDIGLRHVLDRGARLNLVAPNLFPLPYLLSCQDNDAEEEAHLPGNCVRAWILTSVVCNDNRKGCSIRPSPQAPVDLDSFQKEIMDVNRRFVQEIEALSKIGLLNWSKFTDFYSTSFFYPCSFPQVQSFLSSSPQIDSSGAFEYASSVARYGYPQCLPFLLRSSSQTGVVFLGTGCSEPSSWRGGSAILLRIAECNVSMMIDAGEGTFGQMVRYFGEQEAQKIVDSIECIWISHQHGDHCLGITKLVEKRSKEAMPVLILAPQLVIQHLCWAQKSFGFNADLVDIREQHKSQRVLHSQMKMGLDTFLSIVVDHSCEAYGLVLVHNLGWKLVFSGDTRPCELLRRTGMNCTLLIHEATHAPDQLQAAISQKHSTWREALQEGVRMNAYRTILTHFSRRYPNLPTGLSPEELGQTSSIAFDGMHLPFALLPFLPRLNPAIHEALHEIEEGGEIDMSSDDQDSD